MDRHEGRKPIAVVVTVAKGYDLSIIHPLSRPRFEPVWSHLKRSLANLAKRNLAQLTALIKARLKRMQYRPGLLNGFHASTGLDLTPLCNPPLMIF